MSNKIEYDYEYIRKTYGVPAKEGARIVFDGNHGTVVGAKMGMLKVVFDPGTRFGSEEHYVHPTWHLRYYE